MALDIQTIQDNGLRKAAEKADTQGEKSYNGNLDPEEISAFIKNGSESGYSMTDILEVATKVVPKDSPKVQQAIAEDNARSVKDNTKETKKNEIAKLEEQIKTLEKELEQKNGTKEDIWASRKWRVPNLDTVALASMGGMFGIIPGILGLYSNAFKNSNKNKVVFGLVTAIGAIAGAIGSTEIFKGEHSKFNRNTREMEYGVSYSLFDKEPNIPKNYNDSVQYNRAEQFRQEQIVPLEQQISNLKEELNAKKAELEQM